MRPVSLKAVNAAIRGADSQFIVSGCSCADASADSRASAAAAYRKRSFMVAFPRLVNAPNIHRICVDTARDPVTNSLERADKRG
jgi:hypothetical protein